MISPILSSPQTLFFLVSLARKMESSQNLSLLCCHAVLHNWSVLHREAAREKILCKKAFSQFLWFFLGFKIHVLLPVQLCDWAWPQSTAGREMKGEKKGISLKISSTQESFSQTSGREEGVSPGVFAVCTCCTVPEFSLPSSQF